MIPHKVRIKGHIYTLKQVPKSGLPSGCQGYVESDKNLIRIYQRLPGSRKIEVTLHECLHAMLEEHEIKEEERVCNILGERLTEFIKDNPDFILHCLKTLEQS